MIDGLHSSNRLRQLRDMLVNVLDQLGLGVGGTGDQNRAGVRDGLGNGLEILMIRRGMSAADAIGLMMDVLSRMLRMHDKARDVRWTEMENAGFP